MAEGTSDNSVKANIDFVKLTNKELSGKMEYLATARSRVVFWKHTPHFYEGNVQSFNIYLILENCDLLIKFKNEQLCLNFTISGIDYFFKANVIEHDDSKKTIKLDIFDECFRLENRNRSRLQVYPKFEVYAYLKYIIDGPKNLIHFNKKEQKNKDFLATLYDEKRKKLAELSSDLELVDEEDIIGFRVEDITSDGVSFLASKLEKESIIEKLNSTEFKMTINFDLQMFTLEKVSIIYVMDYIHANFNHAQMYKIGVSFKHSPSLKRKIEDISGLDLNTVNYQEKFEEFIKNE